MGRLIVPPTSGCRRAPASTRSNAPRCDASGQLSYRAVGVVRPSVRQAGKRFANHDGIAPSGSAT